MDERRGKDLEFMDVHPTIVFVDLTGSSAAYESFDNAVVAGMVSKITRWVARVGKAHGGQTVKLLGDGVLLQFPASILAVSAAVYLQQHYAEPLGQRPEAMRLGLKVGPASAPIVELNSDSYGDPVNLAARLCDMAGPHDIWADESVFDAELQGQASPSLPAPLPEGVRVLPWLEVRRRPLGLMRVQGLTQPRSVFQVLWNTNVSPDQLTRPGTLADFHAAADQAGLPQLQLRWIDHERVLEAGGAKVRIGRTDDNDLVVGDQRVSREHAQIEWVAGDFVLTDLSRHGTVVRFADAAGSEVQLRRTSCLLHSSGEISLGAPFSDFTAPVLSFELMQPGVTVVQQDVLPLFDAR